jgi:ABC-type amino acid transport substrate-binding protein
VVGSRSEIESVLRNDPAFELTNAPFDRLPRQGWVIGMSVKKDNADLAKLLQAAVNDLFASGEMAALFAKHGVKSVKP